MEQRTVAMKNGSLTWSVQGDRAEVCLSVRPPRPGLYRGLLKGRRGCWDLGLLLPEGGCLRVGRSLSVPALERAGCWPVTGGEAVLLHPFSPGEPPTPPPGWRRVRETEGLFPRDPLLAHCAEKAKTRLMIRRGEDGAFSLAAPWAPELPFPLVVLFCLASVEDLGGRLWVVYRFAADGVPRLPPQA